MSNLTKQDNLIDVKIGRRYKRFGMGGTFVYTVIVNGISTCTTTQKEYVVFTRESNGIMQHMPYSEFIKQTYLTADSDVLVNSFSLVDRIKVGDIFISTDGIPLQVVYTNNDSDIISISPIYRFVFTTNVTKQELWNGTFNVEKYIKDYFNDDFKVKEYGMQYLTEYWTKKNYD